MTDQPARPDQPTEAAKGKDAPEEGRNRPEPHGNPDAGAEKLDLTRTPGDGTLQGATPGGLTTDELRERAETSERTNDTGTS